MTTDYLSTLSDRDFALLCSDHSHGVIPDEPGLSGRLASEIYRRFHGGKPGSAEAFIAANPTDSKTATPEDLARKPTAEEVRAVRLATSRGQWEETLRKIRELKERRDREAMEREEARLELIESMEIAR